jgi:hypothetical protein
MSRARNAEWHTVVIIFSLGGRGVGQPGWLGQSLPPQTASCVPHVATSRFGPSERCSKRSTPSGVEARGRTRAKSRTIRSRPGSRRSRSASAAPGSHQKQKHLERSDVDGGRGEREQRCGRDDGVRDGRRGLGRSISRSCLGCTP